MSLNSTYGVCLDTMIDIISIIAYGHMKCETVLVLFTIAENIGTSINVEMNSVATVDVLTDLLQILQIACLEYNL